MSIGIIISCYKQWKYMKAAIESVLNQTYQDWHLYIINDEYCSHHPYYDDHVRLPVQLNDEQKYKITYYFDGRHKGLAKRINEGLQYCKEDYVILLGADDIIDPHYLKTVSKHIKKHPGLIWLYGCCEILYKENTNKKELYVSGKFDRKRLQKINYIPCCSVVFNKDTVRQIGFNEKLTWAEDWEMWLLLSKFYKPHYLPVCAYTRNDKTSVMRNDLSGKGKLKALKRRIKKWLIKRKFRSK